MKVKILKFSKAKYPYKYKVSLEVDDKAKTIKFGRKPYKDFTIYSTMDEELARERKKAYLRRHKAKENWNKSGITTRGFWSRWILWNQPTVEESLKHVKLRFNLM